MTQPLSPTVDADAILAADRDRLWHHLTPHHTVASGRQMVVVAGDGLRVTDVRGRSYLDATSGGVWCVNLGFGRRRIVAAVAAAMEQMPYFAGSVGTLPAIQLADELLRRLPGMQRVYFSNSGSEANEKSYKIVRQAAAQDRGRRGKVKILFRDRDYHGTTIATLASSGQPERRRDFGPFPPGFVQIPHCLCYRCPFERTYPACDIQCARQVEAIIQAEGPDSVGALIVEPITAGGGIIVPVDEYFPILQTICRKYDLLLIMDEVVTGFGRTGRFFGHEHFAVAPEMITLAKGMASAYAPISATLVQERIYQLFAGDPQDPDQRLNFFRDISTYAGCTAGMAASLETMRILEEEDLVESSRRTGRYLLERLKELCDHPAVGDVRGRGLFCGVELVSDQGRKTPLSEARMAAVVAAIKEAGVLVGRTNSSLPGLNNTLYFAPALTATPDEVDQMVAATRKGLDKGA